MKIKKFKQIDESKEEDLDEYIIIDVTMKDHFQCTLADIKETEAYYNNVKWMKESPSRSSDETDEEIEKRAIYYGLEEYSFNRAKGGFSFKIVDNAGNEIENLNDYREYIKDTKKYNL
jgi:hypothetical protein